MWIYKDRGCTNSSSPRQKSIDQKTKLKIEESLNYQKDRKKNTCLYYGKTGNVEKMCWKKSTDLEEKVKKLEGYVIVVHLTSCSIDDFTFNL